MTVGWRPPDNVTRESIRAYELHQADLRRLAEDIGDMQPNQ
jgi:hypothetical protein